MKRKQDNERWRGCGPDIVAVMLAVIGLSLRLFGAL